jgi:ribosomal protein L32
VDIKQCRRCRKIFQYRGNPTCPDCIRELDTLFDAVKNFLYDNPRSSIAEICQATDVPESDLMTWMREGRLIMSKEAPPALRCEVCGKPIHSGRWCPACHANVVKGVEDAAGSFAPKPDVPAPRVAEDDSKGMHITTRK